MKHRGDILAEEVRGRMAGVVHQSLMKNWPTAVHVIERREEQNVTGEAGVLDCPRFSICLSAEAKYWVKREGKLEVLSLRRGEAVFVAAQGMMEPHPEGRYLALGVVFAADLTKFLVARKHPTSAVRTDKRGHRFLLAHHSPWVMDAEVKWMIEVLVKHGSRMPEDAYLCGLLRLLMIKAKEGMHAEANDAYAGAAKSGRAKFSWLAACHFVQEHLHEGIDRGDVAGFLRLHPNHVSRLFTQFGGQSFNAYLVKARLQRAQRLLTDPAMNVSEVARACGFSEANYFIRCYKRAFGMTPGNERLRREDDKTSKDASRASLLMTDR